MKKIAIIGTGKLGTRLAEELIMEGVCNELHLWNRSRQRLEGVCLSLKVWANQLPSECKIDIFKWKELNSFDAIVIAIKEQYDPRELIKAERPNYIPFSLRYIGIRQDLPLLKDICNKLSNYKGNVIILTNPVDIMTTFATKWLNNKATVVGLGATIDASRLSYIIDQDLHLKVDYTDCLVCGEHGGELFAIESLLNQNRKLFDINRELLSKYIYDANKISVEIVKNIGYTLQECALVFSRDIAWLLGLKKKQKYSSFSIVKNEISIARPVTLRLNRLVVKDELFSDEERSKIVEIEKKLQEMINNLEIEIKKAGNNASTKMPPKKGGTS